MLGFAAVTSGPLPHTIEEVRKNENCRNTNTRDRRVFPAWSESHSNTAVRFDDKAQCATALGLIDDSLRKELVELYEARNAIHIHAEIRKGLAYEIALTELAYRRMQKFKKQVAAKLKNLNL